MPSLLAATPRGKSSTVPESPVALRILRTDSLDDGDSRLASLLDDVEVTRARAFRVAADRKSYIGAHALLRVLLSDATGGTRAPQSWRFEAGPRGKPALAAGPAFNLSHCRGMVAVAVARDVEIGVDVEALARSDFDEDAIAQSTFHAAERERLSHIEDASRRKAAFLATWTSKEALVKAIGEGLSMPLDGFAVDLERIRYEHGAAREWRLQRWELPGHVVALASPYGTRVECRESSWDDSRGVFVHGEHVTAVQPEGAR